MLFLALVFVLTVFVVPPAPARALTFPQFGDSIHDYGVDLDGNRLFDELRIDFTATVLGGELLGEPEAGRIVEGGSADFFLVHGDPLMDPTALWRVWRVAWLPEAVGPAEPTTS